MLHLLPDLAAGGGQRLVLDVLRNLDPSRFEVTVAHVGADGTMADDYTRAGLPPVALPLGSRLGTAAALVPVLRLVRQRRIAIVHTHGGREKRLGEVTAFLSRRPFVQHVHAMPHSCPGSGPFHVPVHRRFLSRLLERHFIAVSDPAYEQRRGYLEAAGDRVHLVRNGIDLARFTDPAPGLSVAQLRAGQGLEPGEPVLISVSRLVPGKAVARLVPVLAQVARRWPAAVLLIVGDGPERGRLEAAMAAAGLAGNVRFLGTRGDVPQLLALADVFVFPTQLEGFGLVAAEAMAAGVPLVASDLPPLRAIVDDGRTGLLVPPGDDEALTGAVMRILSDPDLAERLRKAARQEAEARLGITSTAAALEAVYEGIVAGR